MSHDDKFKRIINKIKGKSEKLTSELTDAIDSVSKDVSDRFQEYDLGNNVDDIKGSFKEFFDVIQDEYAFSCDLTNPNLTLNDLKVEEGKLLKRIELIKNTMIQTDKESEHYTSLQVEMDALMAFSKLIELRIKQAFDTAKQGGTISSRTVMALEHIGLATYSDLYNLCKSKEEDVSRTTARGILTENKNLSKDKIEALARALDVCPAWLAFGRYTVPDFVDNETNK